MTVKNYNSIGIFVRTLYQVGFTPSEFINRKIQSSLQRKKKFRVCAHL